MPRLLFPFRYGSVPAAVSVVTEAPIPSRWANVSGVATNWRAADAALQTPRFEAVRWQSGRQQWNNAPLGGGSAYEVSPQFPFLVSPDGTVVVASEATLSK